MNTVWVKDAILLLFIAWTLIMGVMTVALPNVFHNALAFVGTMFGVAVLFLFLNSEFIAVIQVLIYIGAVAVVIVFAIMLSPPIYEPSPPRRLSKVLLSMGVSLVGFALLSYVVLSTTWPLPKARLLDFSVGRIGWLLLTEYALPFEIISVVLLVAIIGSVLIAGRWELLQRPIRKVIGTPR